MFSISQGNTENLPPKDQGKRKKPREGDDKNYVGLRLLRYHAGMIMGMKAYVLIKVQTGKAHQVLAALKPLSTGRQAHVCFSRPDIICFVEATGDRALSILVLPGVLETETQIVIED